MMALRLRPTLRGSSALCLRTPGPAKRLAKICMHYDRYLGIRPIALIAKRRVLQSNRSIASSELTSGHRAQADPLRRRRFDACESAGTDRGPLSPTLRGAKVGNSPVGS